MFLAVVDEFDPSGFLILEDNSSDQGLGNNSKVRPVFVGFEIPSSRVATLSLVGACAGDCAECVVETNMIAAPRIDGLLVKSSDVVRSLDDIVFHRQAEVVETRPYWPTRPVVFSDERHC